MQEDLQKKFILLSQVAKEKKYAQEYMGLLARRGDIGSIRIGKRWYTTWAWFEEFLENSQRKPSFAKASAAVETMADKPADKKEVVSEAQVVQPVMRVQREEKIVEEPAKITVAVKTKKDEIIPGRSAAVRMVGDVRGIRRIGEMRETRIQPEITQTRNIIQKKNENPLPYKEIKFRKNKDVFSPVFGVGEKVRSTFFPKLVFATGFAIMFLLVAASGYFVFSDGIFKKGAVAGASSERNGTFSGISSEGEYFLASAGDKIKESLSVSRVAVEAAKERGNIEN